ncbi:MAG: hypothetical protein H6845_00905 [Alphaproteobacteria bacterium]|nr:MAG: hypothetical protein H6845_00905 [Alphaproteobacteria bacterium]
MITKNNQFVKVVLSAFVAKLRQNGDIRDIDFKQFRDKTNKLAYQAYLFLKHNLANGVLNLDEVYQMWLKSRSESTTHDVDYDDYELPE